MTFPRPYDSAEEGSGPYSSEENDHQEPALITVIQDPTRYCENVRCAVLIFLVQYTEHLEPQLDENCPGCGQFGRKKGQQQ